jgi:hypothetical protein
MRQKGLIVLIIFMLTLMIAGMTHTRASAAAGYCYQAARLSAGTSARVTLYPNQPNRVRNDASYYSTVLGYIPAGSTFTVLSGPVCNAYTNWWQVNYNGVVGWTAEGDGGSVYWLEPVVYTPPPPQCALTTRLSVGGYGRVTPGLPNTIRNGAGQFGGSVRIGYIPGGGVFNVIGGPQCASDGRWWWQVNYNGLIGWTAEGQNSYWLEPWNGNTGPFPPPPPSPPSCALPNRLIVGGMGRVTPGLPNFVRSAPGTQSTGANSTVIGSIPGGGVFTVLSGPSCGTDGRWWWYVNYNGLVGWTGEGEGYSSYWVEPYYGY